MGKENWEVTPQQRVPVFFVSLLPLPWTGRCSRTGWCLSCSLYFLSITNYLNLCNFINKRDWFGPVSEAKNPRLLGLAPWMAWWRSERSCHQTQRSGSCGSSLRDPVRFAVKFPSWFTLPEKTSSPANEPLWNQPHPNHSTVWGNCKCPSHGQGGQAFLRVLWYIDPELSSLYRLFYNTLILNDMSSHYDRKATGPSACCVSTSCLFLSVLVLKLYSRQNLALPGVYYIEN